MSTKLKLLGSTWPRLAMRSARRAVEHQWTDGPQQIYKKIVVSQDGKALLGGVLVGCQRLCHAAADDAERHGAAAASGESDPARAGGPRRRRSASRRCRTARRSAPAITSAKAISAGAVNNGAGICRR